MYRRLLHAIDTTVKKDSTEYSLLTSRLERLREKIDRSNRKMNDHNSDEDEEQV